MTDAPKPAPAATGLDEAEAAIVRHLVCMKGWNTPYGAGVVAGLTFALAMLERHAKGGADAV